MNVKIFWQVNCPYCPPAKKLGKKLEGKGVKVEYHDVKSVDGLAEAAYFNVLSTPSLIVTNEENKEVMSWRGKVPTVKEIKKILK